jgi:tetratricopeptide (TPR) repeat protein
VRRSAIAQEVEYLFQHALVQETVYESILQKTRKELHLKVANAIETTFADRLADFYGVLAYHWSRAENLAKAEEYLFKAGDEAARSAASSEALAFFREASRLYLLSSGTGGDPRKKALLERNIGLALKNTGQLTESIAHFDQALEHLGERVPRHPLAIWLRFARDMAAVGYRVYLRAGRYGKVKDLDREREVSQLLYHRGQAEITSDPRRLFLQTVPNGLRRFNRIDPRLIEHACSIYVSCAGVFAYSGFSFAISKRMLAIAETLVREEGSRDDFIHREARFTYHYLHGEWGDEHTIDPRMVEQALRYGEVWDVTTYLGIDCDRRARRGDFAGARRDLALLRDINDSYGYGFAGTSHDSYLMILHLEERDLTKTLQVAERYLAGVDEYSLKLYALSTIAEAHVRRGDRAAAAAALNRARETGARSTVLAPWHESTYQRARLLFDVTALEACSRSSDPAAWRAARRAATRSAGRAVRVAAKVAKERVAIYRLVGRVAWLLGKEKRALAWWTRALSVGEHLGARPELARTCAEVGRRLGAPGTRHTTLAGTDAAAYRARAASLFAEIGLPRDGAQDGIAEPETAGSPDRPAILRSV